MKELILNELAALRLDAAKLMPHNGQITEVKLTLSDSALWEYEISYKIGTKQSYVSANSTEKLFENLNEDLGNIY